MKTPITKQLDRDTGEAVKKEIGGDSNVKPTVEANGGDVKQHKKAYQLILTGLLLPDWEQFFDEYM